MPPETTFEDKVLAGVEGLNTEVKAIKTQEETILSDITRLDKETKKAFEELTKIKNTSNDVAEITAKLKKVEIALRQEKRMAFGSPIQRIQNDERLRTSLNRTIRAVLNPDGMFNDQVKFLTKALGEDDSSLGTAMKLDVDILKELFDVLAVYGVWNTLGVRRMGTKVTKLPIKTARPVAGFITTEGGTLTDDTTIAGTSVNLQVEVLAVLLNVSLQLLEDAEFDVTADVLDDFAEAWSAAADYASFMGNGVANTVSASMTGVFNYGTASVAASTHTTVGALTLADVYGVFTTVAPIVLMRPARWWMHPQMLARVGTIKDSTGRPLFQTVFERPEFGAIGSIAGYPITLAFVAPNTDGAGVKVAAFGDPNAMAVGIRRDFVFEASDHYKWNALQRSFRGWGRFGVKGRSTTGFAILTTSGS